MSKKKSDNAKDQITPEKAREALRMERENKMRSCQAEINAVLRRYGCRLQPTTVIEGDKITAMVNIIQEPRQ